LKKLSEEKSFSFIGNIRGRVLISWDERDKAHILENKEKTASRSYILMLFCDFIWKKIKNYFKKMMGLFNQGWFCAAKRANKI
jgi:hypothetical protein